MQEGDIENLIEPEGIVREPSNAAPTEETDAVMSTTLLADETTNTAAIMQAINPTEASLSGPVVNIDETVGSAGVDKDADSDVQDDEGDDEVVHCVLLVCVCKSL